MLKNNINFVIDTLSAVSARRLLLRPDNVLLQSHSQFVESLLWPLVDGRYRAVVVEVVELLPDEQLLVLGLGVGGGRARPVRLLRNLHRDLDADLPEVAQRRVQAAHLQVSRRHQLGQTLGRGEENLKIFDGR